MLAAYAEGDAAGSIEAVLDLSQATPGSRLDRTHPRAGTPSTHAASIRTRRGTLDDTRSRSCCTPTQLCRLPVTPMATRRSSSSRWRQTCCSSESRVPPDRFRSLAPRWYVDAVPPAARPHRPACVGSAARAWTNAPGERSRDPRRERPCWRNPSPRSTRCHRRRPARHGLPETIASSSGASPIAVKRGSMTPRNGCGRAADLEPGNDDTLLHLGRVRALRFDEAEALTTLGAVLERTPSDDTAYLAAIFIACRARSAGPAGRCGGRLPEQHSGGFLAGTPGGSDLPTCFDGRGIWTRPADCSWHSSRNGPEQGTGTAVVVHPRAAGDGRPTAGCAESGDAAVKALGVAGLGLLALFARRAADLQGGGRRRAGGRPRERRQARAFAA